MVFYNNLVELCVSATDSGTDTYARWTLELGARQIVHDKYRNDR